MAKLKRLPWGRSGCREAGAPETDPASREKAAVMPEGGSADYEVLPTRIMRQKPADKRVRREKAVQGCTEGCVQGCTEVQAMACCKMVRNGRIALGIAAAERKQTGAEGNDGLQECIAGLNGI